MIKTALKKIISGQDLNYTEMKNVMQSIMSGGVVDIQLAALLTAFECKGITVDELTASAAVIRELALAFPVQAPDLIDIVGTGGDERHLFNISTCSTFVVAACGPHVAKHLGRAVTTQSGSAELLQQAGIALDLTATHIQQCIQEFNLGFIFAPQHNHCFQHLAHVRKSLGIRTLFNLLGPLTNPAPVKNHLIGVFSPKWQQPFAQVLKALGSKQAWIVHSDDGLDEISIAAPTQVVELRDGKIREFQITPEQCGLNRGSLEDLRVASPAESLQHIHAVLNNEPSAGLDMVALNAGAAIYLAGRATDLQDGVQQARQALASGAAKEKLQQIIQFTQQCSNVRK